MLAAIQTPDQVTANREAEQQAKMAAYQSDPIADALAGHVKSCWEIAKSSRMPLTNRLLDCLRRKNGEYDPQKLALIKKTGGSEIYMMLTTAKVRAAKAWLSDLFNPAGDRPWTLQPTPIPDLPPEIEQKLIATAVHKGIMMGVAQQDVMALLEQHRERLMDELQQEAEARAEKMADQIEDVFVEAGWRGEFDKFLDDVCTYPFAIMRGLEYVSGKTLQWVDVGTGEFVPQIAVDIKPQIRRVSPFHFFPSPAITHSFDGHWTIEHHRYSRSDLAKMRLSPGYKKEAIAAALIQYSHGGLREWMYADGERQSIEGKSYSYHSEDIDALEWCGSIQGRKLIEWGMNVQSIPDPFDEYQVSITVVGP